MKGEADFEYPIDMKRKRGRHMEAEEKVLNIRISVRDLVEFVLRSGDIDNRKGGGLGEKEAMQEGSRIHRKIQGKMGSAYRAEVPLGITLPGDGYTLTVEGRADGIFTEQDTVWIDEIKSMYRDPDTLKEAIPVHLAQAKCYAHIYALQHGLDEIGVQMTYCSLETEEIRRFREMLPTKELSGCQRDRCLPEVGGVSKRLEGASQGFDSGTGVPISMAGRSEKAGDGCVSHDPSEKEPVFAGANRYRKDALYRISGGKGSRGRAGGADFLCDGQDDHPDRRRRGIFCPAREWTSFKDADADSQGKGLPVRGDGMQSGCLPACKRAF